MREPVTNDSVHHLCNLEILKVIIRNDAEIDRSITHTLSFAARLSVTWASITSIVNLTNFSQVIMCCLMVSLGVVKREKTMFKDNVCGYFQ